MRNQLFIDGRWQDPMEPGRIPVFDPFRGTATRWRTRHRRAVSRRDPRTLFEPRRAVLTSLGDAVHDALSWARGRGGRRADDAGVPDAGTGRSGRGTGG